jgi:transcriptional regulator with XRE-family HTH domain
VYGPIELPDAVWQRAEVRQALRARDVAALLRFVQRHGGVSQARIGAAVDMTQGRVNEIINGRRDVSRLDVYERIADGLGVPDDGRHLLGLASRREEHGGESGRNLSALSEIVRVHSAQNVAAAEIRDHARVAVEVDVLAVRGLGLLALNDSLMREALSRGPGKPRPRLRVALLHPESPAVAVRAAEIGETPESLAAGIRLSEARLRDLTGTGRFPPGA